MHSLAAGIAKAGTTDTEKLVSAFRGLSWEPRSAGQFRAIDHQSTMGAYVGDCAQRHGTMADSVRRWRERAAER
jgi:branched-chain amino acid transport system substrate-binding protein